MELKKLIDDAADKTPNIPPVFIQKFDLHKIEMFFSEHRHSKLNQHDFPN